MTGNNQFNKAFSLIEILVSITIILIMTVAISVTFLGIEEELALSRFRDRLITDLNYARMRSMNCERNFGIHIETPEKNILFPEKAILFRDDNEDNIFHDTVDAKIREINSPEGMFFAPDMAGHNIVFGRNGELAYPPSSTNIDIQSSYFTKVISINRIGLIE